MDMQKPGPRGRSSSINLGPGAAVECKTPGSPGGGGGEQRKIDLEQSKICSSFEGVVKNSDENVDNRKKLNFFNYRKCLVFVTLGESWGLHLVKT